MARLLEDSLPCCQPAITHHPHPSTHTLHWLPVLGRVHFKVLLFVLFVVQTSTDFSYILARKFNFKTGSERSPP